MAVINVACPYCSKQAAATVPADATVDRLRKNKLTGGMFSGNPTNYCEVACGDGHKFFLYYDK